MEPTAEIENLRAVAESLEKMLDRLSHRIRALRTVKPGQQ
jgi:hypothetical protein